MRGGGLTNGSVFNMLSHHGDVGDHEHGDVDDADLYIIGAVCHKSDYFAQRNFLEPSGTI